VPVFRIRPAGFLVSVLLCACAALPAAAQQVSFNLSPDEDLVTYSYVFKDHGLKDVSFAFIMPRENVLASAVDFDPANTEAMRRRVIQTVQRYAKGYERTLSMQVMFDDKDRMTVYGNFRTPGERERMTQAAETIRRRAIFDYMQENMVTFGPYEQLVPDVARAASENAKYLTPLVPALEKLAVRANQRDMANLVAAFVQAIPAPQRGVAAFSLPLSTLTLNKGSYASKAAAYAAIMRAVYPDLRMITLNLRERTYVGLMIPERTGDYTLRVYDQTFVIVDPNPQRPMEAGTVSYRAHTRDEYTYFEIPRAHNN
jgi:hypothetical protein